MERPVFDAGALPRHLTPGLARPRTPLRPRVACALHPERILMGWRSGTVRRRRPRTVGCRASRGESMRLPGAIGSSKAPWRRRDPRVKAAQQPIRSSTWNPAATFGVGVSLCSRSARLANGIGLSVDRSRVSQASPGLVFCVKGIGWFANSPVWSIVVTRPIRGASLSDQPGGAGLAHSTQAPRHMAFAALLPGHRFTSNPCARAALSPAQHPRTKRNRASPVRRNLASPTPS